MRFLKKLILAALSLSLLVQSAAFPVQAAEGDTFTQDQKAALLNQLDILQGDGTGYKLDAQLKRSEAAAFIVRLLGMEDEVVQNAEDYIYTSYTDVSPDEWYAKYVGYCDEKGIINGYSDKTFRPNDYVSERAFVKLVLSALTYAYNIDFTWSSVFKKALDVGIVSGNGYSTMSGDNNSYTRGGVVDAVFAALTAKPNGSSPKLLETFLENGLMSESDAVEYGFITNTVDTQLASITVIDAKSIDVAFNEPVTLPILEDLFIFEAANTDAYLPIASIAPLDDTNTTFRLTLSKEQGIDVDYILSIAAVTDKEGANVTEGLDGEFLGFRPDVIESNYFMISKVSGISENVVYVYFTHPVNENILVPGNFTLLQDGNVLVKGDAANVSVSLLTNTNNGIALNFKSFTFEEEDTFTLRIDGDAISKYGVFLKDGAGDQVSFDADTKSNRTFELIEALAISDSMIRLVFNRAVNPTLAAQKYNFYLTDSDDKAIEITQSTVDTTSENVIFLKVNATLDEEDSYTLMVNILNDASKLYYITETAYQVKGDYEAAEEIEIDGIDVVDGRTLTLILSNPPDADSARTLTNYSVKGISNTAYVANPVAIYYEPGVNSHQVKLFFDTDDLFNEDDKYRLYIHKALKDRFGNMLSSEDSASFTCEDETVIEAAIESAAVVGEDTVKLSFNKELALDVTNISTTNFFASYSDNGTVSKKIPLSVNYIDPTTIILKFNALDEDTAYTIGYVTLKDFLGQTYSFTNEDSVKLDWE